MTPKPPKYTENGTERLVNDLEESINTKTKELDSGIKTRDTVIKRQRASFDDYEQKEEDSNDSNVTTDAYDTTEEGEVKPSEDELTNVHYSENKNIISTPIPGPSRARSGQTKEPGPPTKSKSQEEKPIKKRPSPIKYPEANEQVHNDEDVPLSRLTTPKRSRPIARQDLRNKLEKVPIFSKPKLQRDKGPLQSRINRDQPGPWTAGCAPKCGMEHRHHPFIASSAPARPEENPKKLPRVNPANYWFNRQIQPTDSMEEGEVEEKVSEDDISTDERGRAESSEENN